MGSLWYVGALASQDLHQPGKPSMPAQLIDGKSIAREIREGVKAQVDARNAAGHRAPGLAGIQVGNDPASAI
jgi:hypothetical protein